MRRCDAPQIVLNLRAGSVSPAPIGIRSEGITVEMRRHIACQPGKGIARAGSVSPAPIGIRSEGITVEMRRHIACQPGIGIVPPRTAEVIGFFEENHVCDADFPQFYRSHDPGRARADDCYPQLSSFVHSSRLSDIPLKIPLAI